MLAHRAGYLSALQVLHASANAPAPDINGRNSTREQQYANHPVSIVLLAKQGFSHNSVEIYHAARYQNVCLNWSYERVGCKINWRAVVQFIMTLPNQFK
ncbi:hypothetical protein JMJ56_25440 [Belnapia sp. T18]|uniref:Uncharacterized protein n=1 Tax=Belnapia arida TaxID=2804533 RepID=A0ABS1U9L9_9PROT|nr:hypothetical protein [Belnapia arida]MBL6081344.1 hypothetical protein [Belnapia arida]